MELSLPPGALIAGKYAVERVLGEGGMGVVVAASHIELGERVALKFLLPEAAKNPEACARFVREARAAAKIKGEHVARVLDVGVHQGLPFIVMECLEGTDLGRLLETRGPLAVSDAVHYLLQACEAVARAHAAGIVHRDLKPANLFLTTSPDGAPLVKVLDFGISKTTSVFARTLSPDLTTVNASVGTPQYMSPEQARDSGNVDVRTDVWALGAILYELLAGTPAFDGDDLPAIVMMIGTEEPRALESLRPDVPLALTAVARRCLQKNRDARFADVAELARALEPFANEEARPSVARVARILGHDSLPPAAIVDTTPVIPVRRPRWVAVALAGAVALSLRGFVVWSKRGVSFSAASPVLGQPAEATVAPPAAAPVTEQNPAGEANSAILAPATNPRDVAPVPPAPRTKSSDTSASAPQAPAPAPARARAFDRKKASAQRFDAVAPNELGVLTFQANVPAEVTLDGRALGPTPQSVVAAPGNHTVVFVHPELGEKTHAVSLSAGQEKTLRATFEPRSAE